MRHALAVVLNHWPWPLLWVLGTPVVLVPFIGTQVPFALTSPPDVRPPVVATDSPFGSSTVTCDLLPSRAPGTRQAYACPTVRPLLPTYLPGLLYLVAGAWLVSPHPRVRAAARSALFLGMLQCLAPIGLDRHPLEVDCDQTGCLISTLFLAPGMVAAGLGMMLTAGVLAGFLGASDRLSPAPLLARGASANAPFERPWEPPA